MDQKIIERIHALWDQLADFDVAGADAANNHLLASLCALVDAQNACWVGAVRMDDAVPGDPVHGWRPHTIHFLHPAQILQNKAKEQRKHLEQGQVDETTIRNVALAGRFRVNRVADLVPESWFDSDYYHNYYRGVGHEDVIWAGCPVTEDAEVYIGITRDTAHPRFSVEERETVAYALRGLKWFHRKTMLGYGLLVATTPLTPVERNVLHGLLAGESEKQIANALRQSHHTTHEHVSNILRKFGVNNRPSLMAIWLGKSN